MKITIGGETFDYDPAHRLMSEALAIEKAWGRRYAEWLEELEAGSAEAVAVFAWVILRREGRDVPLSDILEGKKDFDYFEMQRSLNEAWAQETAQAADPTPGAVPLTAPDGTATTRSGTSGGSPRSSASGRGKSGS